MYKIAVCDDDKLQLSFISEIIDKVGTELIDNYKIHTYENVQDLLKNAHNKFDLIFLDIRMRPMSGFDAAQKLKETDGNQNIVFITSEHGMVYDSFEFEPINFIRKRSREEIEQDIRDTMHRVLKEYTSQKWIVLIAYNGAANRVYIKDIVLIQSDKNYVYYYLINGEVIKARETLIKQYNLLKNHNFIQVNKGAIVNLLYIETIDIQSKRVVVKKTGNVTLGRKYEKSAREKYLSFLLKE